MLSEQLLNNTTSFYVCMAGVGEYFVAATDGSF